MASAEATLHDDERELGVALIDIGGGTTDLAVFADGAIVYTSVLAVGGHHGQVAPDHDTFARAGVQNGERRPDFRVKAPVVRGFVDE